ncbi:MAG TPA: urease accessory protein UreD [Myxococcota bacterium]|nr:urease accessory protein UreD [Myxococcota bacterium]
MNRIADGYGAEADESACSAGPPPGGTAVPPAMPGTPHRHRAPAPDQGGWQATLRLGFARRRGRSLVVARQHEGPLRIQRAFHPEGDDVCHVYLLHPPAGIVAGDRLSVDLEVGADSHALVTTPGATRWYDARGRAEARLEQRSSVAAGACLEWLPQESIFFDGAAARQSTRFALDEGARLIAWEITGLGRPAAAEPYARGRLDLRLELEQGGRPRLLERQRTWAGRLPGLRGAAAIGQLVCTPSDDAMLESVRRRLEGFAHARFGVTRIDDLLVARALAHHCEPIALAWRAVWETLRPAALGRPASAPRIWRT